MSYVILLRLEITQFLPGLADEKNTADHCHAAFVSTHAVADTDLYSGEVLVSSQGQADRDAALPDALIQVLQKLSGQREIPASPALDEALNSADRILRSYRYTRVDLTAADGSITEELRLVATVYAVGSRPYRSTGWLA